MAFINGIAALQSNVWSALGLERTSSRAESSHPESDDEKVTLRNTATALDDDKNEQGSPADDSILPLSQSSSDKDEQRPAQPRLKHLDGLRAVAILIVVFYHYELMPCVDGYAGVDCFFVFSGYLMTRVLRSRISKPLHIAGFYERRFWRIYPNSVATVLATLVGAFLILENGLAHLTGKAATAALGMYSNYHYLSTINYWLPEARVIPLLHMWSLGIEEQFYLIWPTLILILTKIDPALSRAPDTSHRKKGGKPIVSTCVIGFIMIASYTYYNLVAKYDSNISFFSIWAHVWEFCVGGLAELWYQDIDNFLGRWTFLSLVMSAGGIATAAGPCFLEGIPLGYQAVPPVVGTAIALVAGKGPFSEHVLGSKAASVIGRHSYAGYLVHWPVWVFLKRLNAMLLWPKFVIQILALAIGVICTLLLQYRVELPFHKPSRKRIVNIVVLVGVTVLMTWISRVSYGFTIRVERAPEPDLPQCPFESTPDMTLANTLSLLPHETPAGLCQLGWVPRVNATESHYKLNYDAIVVGNSFAKNFASSLAMLSKDRPFRVLVASKEGCGFMHLPSDRRQKMSEPFEVPEWIKTPSLLNSGAYASRCRIEAAIRWNFLSALPLNQTVFVVTSFEEQYADGETPSQLRKLVRDIRSLGHSPILVTPPPGFAADNPAGMCAETFRLPLVRILRLFRLISNDLDRACPPFSRQHSDAAYGRRVALEVAKATDTEIIDRNEMLCKDAAAEPGQELCRLHENGETLYFDRRHLSIYGQARVGKRLAQIV